MLHNQKSVNFFKIPSRNCAETENIEIVLINLKYQFSSYFQKNAFRNINPQVAMISLKI